MKASSGGDTLDAGGDASHDVAPAALAEGDGSFGRVAPGAGVDARFTESESGALAIGAVVPAEGDARFDGGHDAAGTRRDASIVADAAPRAADRFGTGRSGTSRAAGDGGANAAQVLSTGNGVAESSASAAAVGVSRTVREERPELATFGALLERVRTRFPSEQVHEITRAFGVARDAHEGQTRHSGEPYLTHPVAVAGIVLDMQLDHVSVMGALLHDVLEDTDVTRGDLVAAFGEELAHVVDGLSKLTSVESLSKEEAQAESFRKMLLAMVSDIRVILIKLADRLHNMRTIGALRPDKQRRIGRETLDVYAPIASRLGIYSVKNELEDLGFRAVYPMRARVLAASVEQARRQSRGSSVARVAARLEAALGEEGIDGAVTGRDKHLYSLYTKMLKKQLPFQRVFDLTALRVVVGSSVDECYRVLGIVHRLYKPISRPLQGLRRGAQGERLPVPCTPCSPTVPTACRSRCRSGRARWTPSPSPASPPTGPTRAGRACPASTTVVPTTGRAAGCRT